MVNLALSNGQVVSTTLANLQAMAHTNLLNNTAAAAAASNPGNLTHFSTDRSIYFYCAFE